MSALRNIAIDWYRKVFGAPAGSDIREEGLDCVLDGNSAVALSEAAIATHAVLGGSALGALAVELAADDYILDWRHPYGSGQVGVTVPARDQLTLEAASGPSDGYRAPVTVTLTNVGCNPFSGTLTVEAETGSDGCQANTEG